MSRFLADLAWPDADSAPPGTLLAVPVGATEQHGPHLPLGTDTEIACALAGGLCRLRRDVMVAPCVPYGSSGEHGRFAGTLSIGQPATELLLVELCRSATATFERVLLISAHGGNAGPVGRAVSRLREEGRDVRAFCPCWPYDAHAGRAETGLMLAIAPHRVRLERAQAGATAPLRELLPQLVAHGVREASANGVLGDPAGASAQDGRAILDDAVHELAGLVAEWDSWA
ncbi:MAG: mycofactocin biosynthesis peptidyl-dipeptidase MftE [Solirubrobacteraceae bacterium]